MPDEISTLAEVFALMVSKVKQREESLKQQVTELKIEIDEVKRKKQVSEIVDSDFFHDLQTKARRLRSRAHGATEESKPETIVLNGKVETTNGHQE
jgi:DNA-binding protein H-NS